jgi:hypothetical protein
VTSTTSNALPPLDPAVPIDPSAILEFDPYMASARHDLDLMRDQVNALYPVILLGRMRDPWHREVQKMLAAYKITPAPLIIDVDQRKDHELFIPVLARLLGTDDLPQLLLLGKSLGSYHAIQEMKDSGKLSETLEKSGAVTIRDAVLKKKGVKERERERMERVLGPAPIVAD